MRPPLDHYAWPSDFSDGAFRCTPSQTLVTLATPKLLTYGLLWDHAAASEETQDEPNKRSRFYDLMSRRRHQSSMRHIWLDAGLACRRLRTHLAHSAAGDAPARPTPLDSGGLT